MPGGQGYVENLVRAWCFTPMRGAGPAFLLFLTLAALAGCTHQNMVAVAPSYPGGGPVAYAAETRPVPDHLAAARDSYAAETRPSPKRLAASQDGYVPQARPSAKRLVVSQEDIYYKAVPGTDTDAKPKPAPLPMPPEYKHWPPLHPSARWIYPDAFLLPYQGAPAAKLFGNLERSLLNLGYPDLFYFDCKDGLAMATPFERIDDDGRPLTERRFDVDANLGARSLGEVKKQMFSSYAVRYRAIVFVLSTDKSRNGRAPSSFAKQRHFLGRGLNSLDPRIETAAITPQHQLTAYIYEWTAAKEKSPVYMREDLQVYGLDHLRRSGIPTGADQ